MRVAQSTGVTSSGSVTRSSTQGNASVVALFGPLFDDTLLPISVVACAVPWGEE